MRSPFANEKDIRLLLIRAANNLYQAEQLLKQEDADLTLLELSKSKKKVKQGDYFRFRSSLKGGVYLFGRVIEENLSSNLPPLLQGMLLVYIYNHIAQDPLPDYQALNPSNLIIQPKIVNRLGWRHGYWETFPQLPVNPTDRLRNVYIRTRNEQYFDLGGLPVKKVLIPPDAIVIPAALGNYNSIDAAICNILAKGE